MRQPSHCKTLRDAIDGEGTVHKIGGYLGRSAELEVIIDQMLIDIIAEYPDMGMALQHFGQGAQFVPSDSRRLWGCWAN